MGERKGVKRVTALVLSICMVFGGIFFSPKQLVKAAALNNPRKDSSGNVIWDCVWFGNYPQSDVTGAKKNPIKWRVLEVNGNDAFLVADCNLDVQRYNDTRTNVTWETCTMRKWLNSDFINRAFTSSEQSAIKTTTVVNADNSEYGTEGGNNTQDKVFLLSLDEVKNEKYGFSSDYSDSDKARQRKNTAYAAKGGTIGSDYMNGEGSNHWWWIRSIGDSSLHAAHVNNDGSIAVDGFFVVYTNFAVCPALHLNLLSTKLYSYAGTVCSDGSVNENKPEETTKNDNISNDYPVGKKKQIISAVSQKVPKGTKPFYLNAKTDGDGKLTYKSSNSKVAKISSTGKLEVKEYGTAIITIKASETASYSQAVKKTKITVVPKKMSLKKVFSSGRTRLSVLWKKNNKITGYEIYFSTRKDFKRETYKRLFKKSKNRMDVVGLKSMKKYYVKIRCYKVVGKKKYYSAWSKVRKVKVR